MSLSSFAWLLAAELRKNLLLTLRYPLQPLCGVLILLGLFGAIGLGLAHAPSVDLFEGGDSRVLVASFVCWVVAVGAIGHVPGELEDDIKAGLLEPVFLSRYPVAVLLLARALSGSAVGVLVCFAMLAGLAAWSGADLRLGGSVVLALVLLELALGGIGLAMAGIVILFKRAAGVAPLVQLGLAVLIARGVSTTASDTMLRYPLVSAIETFARSLFGTPLSGMALTAAAAWSLAILATGMAALALCIRRARAIGSLAHY
ncbi:hypothetical protein ACFFTM_09425 [Pseudoduganella plicata]|uniref:Uncharacterized protein n=1 Tax=Pseudoduganella plicata TaxID=321984 RepID=A0AA87Y9T7_9BURK|nr:hypothetical protein [Pseudoduganella plicata]GGZ00817.1 hypothetical protein GCM10007388_37930 [Pseudoduganella plicata]